MHVHLDEAKLKAAIKRGDAELAHLLDEPGLLGAQARLSTSVNGIFSLAIIAEYNRGTSHEDVMTAVACQLANVALSVATSTLADGGNGIDLDEVFARLNFISAVWCDAIKQSLAGEQVAGGTQRVAGEVCGTA